MILKYYRKWKNNRLRTEKKIIRVCEKFMSFAVERYVRVVDLTLENPTKQ